MFELRELTEILCLDEHRHFRRAAESLKISQPTLTKSLQRLEKQLGLTLFDRSRAGVSPTAIGAEIIKEARRVVAAADDLNRIARRFRGVEIGSATIGIGPAMSESFVNQAIANFVQHRPKTQISIRVDHWRQLSEWLLAGELDFFVADAAEAQNVKGFVCTSLPPEEFVWFCRAGHPLSNDRNALRSDIIQFPVVTPTMPAWAKEWFADTIAQEYGPDQRHAFPTVECENYAMLKRMVLSTDCISVALRNTIRDEVQSGLISELAMDAPVLTTNAGIVQVRDRSESPVASLLRAEIVRLANQENH